MPNGLRRAPLAKDPAVFGDDDGRGLASRSFIEESVQLWERALSINLPEPFPEDASERSLGMDEVMTAPLANATDVRPSEIYHYDGFVPVSAADLRRRLRQLARQVFLADLEVTLEEGLAPEGRVAAARVYVFDEPVHEAKGAQGRLFVPSRHDEDAEWQAGQPAAVLVEVIHAAEEQHAEPQRVQLVCRTSETGARWERAGD